MGYELVMGLEVHVELATKSKLFCSCSASFGADANEHVCPACAGMPGMPAVTNKRAVDLGIAAGLVTNSEITPIITFDKKNYFYPDLPAGYQITQWLAPVCRNGWIDIETSQGNKRITLKQIHIEEDAGKLVHDKRTNTSLVDFNRTSVPLVEIVSNPDFRSAEEVIAYLEKLKSLLSFAGVSDCKMQEGSMRCDVNISVREEGSKELGVRSEIKNMNSLKAIGRTIAFEYQRHVDALETGCETLVQETRRWDDVKGETFAMREKENATDYRYFPNPELMPIYIDEEWIQRIRTSLPEPAHEKYLRLTKNLGLPEADCAIITGSKTLSQIFDEACEIYNQPKDIAAWIVGDLLSIGKSTGLADDDIKLDGKKLAKIIELVNENTINRSTGKKILQKAVAEDIDPESYIKEHGLAMVTDTSFMDTIVKEVITENEKPVTQYREGNEKVIGFLIGKLMQKSGGKADPKAAKELLMRALKNE